MSSLLRSDCCARFQSYQQLSIGDVLDLVHQSQASIIRRQNNAPSRAKRAAPGIKPGTPAFAKPGLIPRNPPVQVGEGSCQVQARQPVLIRYQIREVSGSRRTGATLLFLADPKPLTNSSSSSSSSSPPPPPKNTAPTTALPAFTASCHSCHSLQHHQPHHRFSARHVTAAASAAPLISCQQRTL
ncbi:hypothetical protein JOB18_026475 [Solea senegalensis]|uniref:Uncharacterized protein n=1 Tax=Solea senegalensis TaxID=28829 RepID=A0AAV6PV35_SOLSE|nr:hypothetical protein JOB18_026475 [Solea senegalensis]